MNIVEMKVADLIPYSKNAKKHPWEQIDLIKNSIKEFGFKQPLVIDMDNTVVIGHGRLEACKQLGIDTVPCVVADDLTPEQIKALRLADNKVAESEWDFDLLSDSLDEILEINMEDFGFDLDDTTDTEIVEDEVPEIDEEAEPIAKRGDIWQLGRHRLMCGDSTSEDDVNLLMNGNKADMVFTDPPYGYKYESHKPKEERKFEMILNDDIFLNFIPIIKNYVDGFVFICTSWKVFSEWEKRFKECFNLSNVIVWNKGFGGMGDLTTTFAVDYELILVSSNKHKIKNKRIGSVWNIQRESAEKYNHPTQKPVELPATAIKHTTDKNEIVLDVFGGSGSTLIACEQTDRTCYTMELDPKYVDVIIKRYENLTGNKAALLNGTN